MAPAAPLVQARQVPEEGVPTDVSQMGLLLSEFTHS